MIHRYCTRGVLVLAAVLITTNTKQAVAQDVSYSLLLGVGSHSWDGPYIEGGKWGLSLAAAAAELGLGDRVAVRAELGGDLSKADLGLTGLFAEKTTLNFSRVRLAVLGRGYMPVASAGFRFFVEAGATGWRRTTCDIDMVGGPGFLGGETVDCDLWAPDGTSVAGMQPENSGVAALLGIGGYYRRFGLGLRYGPGRGAVIKSTEGTLRVRTVTIVGEWVFNGRV